MSDRLYDRIDEYRGALKDIYRITIGINAPSFTMNHYEDAESVYPQILELIRAAIKTVIPTIDEEIDNG